MTPKEKKKQRPRFKFIPKQYTDWFVSKLEKECKVLKKPLRLDGIENLPDGEYWFRSGERTRVFGTFYYKLIYTRGKWFFSERTMKDAASHNELKALFLDFPKLRDIEYSELYKHYAKLSGGWKENVKAYFTWKNHKNFVKGLKLQRLKLIGK